jgi:hypothetical protein
MQKKVNYLTERQRSKIKKGSIIELYYSHNDTFKHCFGKKARVLFIDMDIVNVEWIEKDSIHLWPSRWNVAYISKFYLDDGVKCRKNSG